MTFRVGDEVVCVDARVRTNRPHVPNLQHGAVYTISGIFLGVDERGLSLPSLHLQELPWNTLDGRSGGYLASRFRKVERRNDSLSIEAFLTIKPGFEEPRRPKAPAKKRERA